MKKAEVIIICFISIIYFIISMWISSFYEFEKYFIKINDISKENFALFGALTAMYTAGWNLYKFIYERFILSEISVSPNVIYCGDNKYKFETVFKNNTKNDIYISMAHLEGFVLNFQKIQLKTNESICTEFIGEKDSKIIFKNKKLNKAFVSFSYKNMLDISKYKTHKTRIKIPCIE